MFRTSSPQSPSLFANGLACLGFKSPAREAVGIDISCHDLHTVTISARQNLNSNSNIKYSQSLAWESRAVSTFLQPLTSSTSGRSGLSSQAVSAPRAGSATHAGPVAQANQAPKSGPTAQQLIKTIDRHLPRQADCGTRIASAVLPPIASVLRWPTSEQPAELTKSIRADLGHAFAPGDSIETCHWSIGNSGRKMIYAVSGGMTSALATELTRLGFNSPTVDSRPHALARAVGLDAVNDANIIIEWTRSDCTLLVTTRPDNSAWRLPQLCRPLHGYALSSVDRIGPHKNSIPTDLRSQSQTKNPNYVPLFRAAAEEIQRTLRFAESLQGVDPSGPILLCGPAAAIPSATQILSETLNREIRPWRWNGQSRPPHHPQEPIDALFAVAIGAACGTLA